MKGLLKDPVFRTAAGATLLFVLGAFVVELLLGMLLERAFAPVHWLLVYLTPSLLLGLAAGVVVYLVLRREQVNRSAFEASLRESEERYRLLFESSIDGILLTAPDGRILAANPAACAMLGRPEADICRLGREGIVDITDPRLPSYLQARRDAGRALGELRLVRGDGAIFPAEVSSGVFLDRDGNQRTSMVIRDISDRKQAEQALADSEARLRSLVANVPAVLWTTDRNLVYTSVQGAGLKALNANPDAMVGKRLAEFLPGSPDEVALVAGMHARALAGEAVDYETTWRQRSYQTHIEPIHEADGSVAGCVGVTLDISERKRAEDALRASENRFRTVFQSAPIAMLLEARDGTILEANPAFKLMMGFEPGELPSLQACELAAPGANRPQGGDAPEIGPRSASTRADRRFRRKDGRELWARVTTTNPPDPDNEAAFGITMVEDITEQVTAYQVLEQRVAERTRELAGLLDISQTITSTLELGALLDLVLDQFQRIVDFTSASLFTVEGDDLVMGAFRSTTAAAGQASFRIVLTDADLRKRVFGQTQPLIISDLRGDDSLAILTRQGLDERLLLAIEDVRSVMWIPLVVKRRVIGGLGIAHAEPGFYDTQRAALAQSLANQAAIAIENARLYEQAQVLATLEERQRLSRELHDSLTQSLYSLTLLAEAAGRQMQAGNRQAAQAYLERIGDAAQQSLKDMRLLVYDLRPAALGEDGLVGALRQRLAAVEGHTGIATRLEIEGSAEALAGVEEDLYGIAQEALNNALKHAGATEVTVSIRVSDEAIQMDISDNGAGFDPDLTGDRGGHGLASMRERAERLGGDLTVQSQPQAGTTVRLRVPATATTPE